MSSVAVIGLGGVGSLVARGLAARPEVDGLWLFDKDAGAARTTAMDAAITAENCGHERITVQSAQLDLADEARIAEAIHTTAPDVIVQTATLRSWFGITKTLPRDVWRELYRRSRFGPWLPVNLVLPLKLMRAKQNAGSRAHVVNVSYPDAVNPVLARLGLAPACGAGNSEVLATVIRLAAAQLLDRRVAEVAVSLIGHHYHLANVDHDEAWRERAFWHRITVEDKDITEELHDQGLIDAVRRACPHGSSVPAAVSAVKNAIRLLRADGELVHCSSPQGMTGGMDVRFGPGGPSPVLPDGVSEDDVARITRVAEQADGIEQIDSAGTVRFGAAEAEAMRELLGYDCAVLPVADAEDRAFEILTRLDELAARASR